jgi:hypothetical protein
MKFLAWNFKKTRLKNRVFPEVCERSRQKKAPKGPSGSPAVTLVPSKALNGEEPNDSTWRNKMDHGPGCSCMKANMIPNQGLKRIIPYFNHLNNKPPLTPSKPR